MKLVMQNTKKNVKNTRKGIRLSAEKILFFSFISAFALLIVVQTILLIPSGQTILSTSSQLEGTILGNEESLYREGDLELELVGSDGDQNLKILINGDEISTFADKNVKIFVRDGDVVEIDGSAAQAGAQVRIAAKSNNIEQDCLDKKIRIKSGIVTLIKVKVRK